MPAARPWWRIHRRKYDPIHFGKSATNRFDAPAGEFGVLYVGADLHCAFIETFGHATGTRSVSEAELRAREIAIVTCTRRLRLVDLRGKGLARMGADAALTSGLDYELAQRWALAIHQHPDKPDGIAYLARHDPTRTSAAIFERAAPVMSAKRTGAFGDKKHERALGEILETYKFALVP